MKLDEINIDERYKLLDFLVDSELTTMIYQTFNLLEKLTSNFVYAHYELFDSGKVEELRQEIDFLKNHAAVFPPDSQAVELINLLHEYLPQ